MSEKIVIKIGGDQLKENLDYVISDIVKLHAENKKIILCHAGADIVDAIAEKMNKPQIFTFSTKGYKSRYVDEETRDIYLMVVAGLNNKRIVKEMIAKDLPAVGISWQRPLSCYVTRSFWLSYWWPCTWGGSANAAVGARIHCVAAWLNAAVTWTSKPEPCSKWPPTWETACWSCGISRKALKLSTRPWHWKMCFV